MRFIGHLNLSVQLHVFSNSTKRITMFNSSGKLINVRNLVPSIRLMRRKRWQGELSSEFGRSCQQNLIFFYLTRDLTKPKQVHQRDTGVARTKTRPLYQIAIFINLHQNVMEWIEIGVLTAQSGSIGGYYPLGKGRLQKPESRKLSVRGGTPPLRNFTPLSVCYFTLSV